MRIVVSSLLLLAILAAAATAILVKRFLESEQTAQVEILTEPEIVTQKETYVLVTEDELLSGKEISSRDVSFRPWPEEMLNDEFIVSDKSNNKAIDEFVGAIARITLPAGIPLTQDMVFRRSNAGFLTGILSPGMRAVSIAIQPQTGAAGFILPGDFVDVIVTYDFQSDDQTQGNRTRQAAETILEKIRVVAVDQQLEGSEEEAIVATTITLEVTPKGAETISLGGQVGKIHLSLRSLSTLELETQKTFTPDYEIFEALTISIEPEEEVEERNANRYTPKEVSKTEEIKPQIKIYRGVTESVSSLPRR
jgi:pilus assembly protein CpaB